LHDVLRNLFLFFSISVYGYLGRSRSSIGSQNSEKPLPPIRRNSSISVSSSPARSMQSTIMSTSVPSVIHNNSIYSNLPTQQQQSQKSSNGIYVQNPHGFSSGETTPHATSMEQLPPPPSYLMGQCDPRHLSMLATLDPDDPALKRMSVAETIKTLTEKNHQPVSPNMVRRAHSMKQPGEEKGNAGQAQIPPKGNSPNSHHSKKNHHQSHNSNSSTSPVSNNHNSVKDRGSLIQLLSDKLSVTQQQLGIGISYGTHIQQQQLQQGGYCQQPQTQQQHIYGHLSHPQQIQQQSSVHHSQQSPTPIYHQVVQLQAAAATVTSQSANNSPRHQRRFSEEILKTTATFVQNRVLGNKTPPPVVTSKEIFVQTLNAKLSQMRVGSPPTDRRGSLPAAPPPKTSFASKVVASIGSHGTHHHPKGNAVGDAAFRVRQWISSKTIPDPTLVRESLMDQIRRGTKLKQTRAVNDRSAPKINH